VSATAQDDVQHHHYQAESARNDIAFDIDDAMEMVMAAAATGKVDWKVSSAHKAREVIHGFAEVVEKMAATAATKETALATSCQVEEEYVDHQITLKAVDIMAAAQNAVTYQTMHRGGWLRCLRPIAQREN
jgi:predicted ribonuclease toxin of YeeF-YezG toxin-antitoxin module